MTRVRWQPIVGAIACMAIGALITFLLVRPDAPADSDDADRTATEEPDGRAPVPADVLDLTNWKLTLPVGDEPDEADEVKQPKLSRFRMNPYFRVNEAGDGVVFRAPVSGATTSGSGYPRSELREMEDDGEEQASWSNKKGVHVMTIEQAITHTPVEKPDVAAGQIHGEDDVVAMVRLEGKRLFVEREGDEMGDLDKNYKLGTRFKLEMRATSKGIRITYNDDTVVRYKDVGDDNYFKAGCYTQASDKPQEDDSDDQVYDKPNAYGEVVIYSLKVRHS